MNNNELYHHGILGQRWGHRNGPPYPLDSKDHSSSEKRAGWKKSLSNDSSYAVKRPSKNKDKDKDKNTPASKAAKNSLKKDLAVESIKSNKRGGKFKNSIDRRRREKILKDPRKLYKHMDEFSESEINAAIKVFDMEKRLRDLSIERMNNGKRFADMALGYVQTGLKWYNTLSTIDKIANSNDRREKSAKIKPGFEVKNNNKPAKHERKIEPVKEEKKSTPIRDVSGSDEWLAQVFDEAERRRKG